MKRVAAPPKQGGGNEAPHSLLDIQAFRQVQRAEREEKGDCDEERPAPAAIEVERSDDQDCGGRDRERMG